MIDLKILEAADALALPSDFEHSHWNVGRSGDLGQGVEVWTSWLPVQGYYETLVHVPEALEPAFYGSRLVEAITTRTRETAYETHRATVQQLQTWLAGVTA